MLKSLLEQGFSDESLIVVSNREPYIHKKLGSRIKLEKPAGGLTSAMDDVLKAAGGIWVAWGSGSADREMVDERSSLGVPPEQPRYTLKRVWLHPGLVENYYAGYSNQVLWPLCHITLDRVTFRKKYWEAYVRVNQAFAKAVLEEVQEKTLIWIHDYHLCLVPAILRERLPQMTLSHFWHIPWPDWSVFRVCPQAKEILEGLLGNDLIGFQIPLFVKNFMGCVRECLKAEVNEEQAKVIYQGREIHLKAFSIGIDYDKFDRMAASSRTKMVIKKIKDKYQFPALMGIGVDRLDYTKALIKRLQAIDLFFEKNRRYKTKVTFFQVAIPTRMQEPYITYKYTVEKLISKINQKFSIGDWKPILYVDTKIEHKDLVAFYRLADFAIISSIYDGMNLVAKEYVASQVDEPGVLILSELAGAAEGLKGALLVNPYDVEDFAECIKKAIQMPAKEKKERMERLRRQVEEEDIYKWIVAILKEMLEISSLKSKDQRYFFNHLPEISRRVKNRKIVLFLDYDGTLTPIVNSPDQALLPEEIRTLLAELKALCSLVVISGRSLKDLKGKLGLDDLILVANHGAEIAEGNTILITQKSEGKSKLLNEFLVALEEGFAGLNGIFIEDKGVTASIHFRQANIKQLGRFFDDFWKTAKPYEEEFRITLGKKVIEIRPRSAWNKGDAVKLILKTQGQNKIPIYVGDDTTDEDAFRSLTGKGLSISIGKNLHSDYYLQGQEEVKPFLEVILKWIRRAREIPPEIQKK